MMGAEQKAWFKQQLLDAKGRYPVLVWVSSVPWIDEPVEGADHWAGYATERREIADFIADNDITGLLMLAGDAHTMAIDDGSNSDYSRKGDAGFPVFHASALDRFGSDKGGPFSEGVISGGGHFGLVSIEDDGDDQIAIELSGRDWTGDELTSLRYTVDVDAD